MLGIFLVFMGTGDFSFESLFYFKFYSIGNFFSDDFDFCLVTIGFYMIFINFLQEK